MKKILTLLVGLLAPALAVSAINLPSLPATANISDVYVGGDIGQTIAGYKITKQTGTVTITERARAKHTSQLLNAYVGYQVTPSVAIEGGIFTSIAGNRNKAKRDGQTKINGFHAGTVFIAPVATDVSLLAGASLAFTNAHSYKPKAYDHKKSVVIPRASMGAQYQIMPGLNVRGTFMWHFMRAHYTNSKTMQMNDSASFGIGLNYSL